jgi:thioredoxin reductase
MSDHGDVAIVGAGPYGLSLAAHLSAAGVPFRHFGMPMELWQSAMPRGMFLKSQGFASNLSSPDGGHTLEAFCAATDRAYASYGLPVPLDTFVAYGKWFQRELVPDVEETMVTDIAPAAGYYDITLADGRRTQAGSVVVAVGVQHFASVPEQLAGLPPSVCTHSSAHTDLSSFRGRKVVVLGAGQSALESGALLHESGADVQLVAQERKVVWNGLPLPLARPWWQRMREPEAGLGSGWSTWFYSGHPDLFRHLPKSTRIFRAKTALGPAGAPWLRARVESQFPILQGHTLEWAKAEGEGVVLGLEGPGGATLELAADHVIAATGYRSDVARLGFLGDRLRSELKVVAGTPVVDRHYQSSVSDLYFVGPVVAPTFGPVMRFVFGSAHAASTVSHHLASTAKRRRPVAVGAT